MEVKGYKVFNPDWTCLGFQYKVGEIYEEDVKPILCERGFHFCEKAVDCFNYYNFDPKNKVAEVIALGEIVSDGIKSCTNIIRIVREIPWQEVLEIVNMGKSCTGLDNSGDYNSGDYNSGNRNSGDYNSGYWNSGDYNSGNRNSGNYNSGDYNRGDYNSGYWNTCSYSNGCFNTKSPKIYLFNKHSEWTYQDWLESGACYLLNQIPDNEVEAQEWYDNLSDEDKAIIKSIPNFDKEIFKEITGIDVDNKICADD